MIVSLGGDKSGLLNAVRSSMWLHWMGSVSTYQKDANVLYILLNQEGCNHLIPQGRKTCHWQPWREGTLHFFISIISLKGGSLLFQVEGCLRINVPKINYCYMQICLHLSVHTIWLHWKNAHETGNTGWVAQKGKGREGGQKARE